MPSTKLSNTRVLIVGGTSGIGFAVASLAVEHGAYVIVASSQSSNVESALQRLRNKYSESAALVAGTTCDIGNQETLESNVLDLLNKATSPDLFPSSSSSSSKVLLSHIVFTAGDLFPPEIMNLSTITVPGIQAANTVRLLAPLILAKHVNSYIHVSAASSLTLTSGTNTKKPMKGWAVAAALGSSIAGAARGLAVDLAPVRVNVVSPGAVKTELFDKVGGDDVEGIEKLVQSMKTESLVGEVARPDDVAEAYVYLMKDRFVDGIVLGSDGGRLLA